MPFVLRKWPQPAPVELTPVDKISVSLQRRSILINRLSNEQANIEMATLDVRLGYDIKRAEADITSINEIAEVLNSGTQETSALKRLFQEMDVFLTKDEILNAYHISEKSFRELRYYLLLMPPSELISRGQGGVAAARAPQSTFGLSDDGKMAAQIAKDPGSLLAERKAYIAKANEAIHDYLAGRLEVGPGIRKQ